MQTPYWYRLINKLKAKGLIDIGPTIPYLIGARRHKDPKFASIPNNIQTLLSEMADSDSEYTGVIQFCDTIQQVVIGIVSTETIDAKYDHAVKVKNKQGRVSLISILDKDKYGYTISDVTKSLINIYSLPIKSLKYSWDPLYEEWGPIFKNELEVIESIDI